MEIVKNKKQLVIFATVFVFVLALICACTNATTAQAKVKKPSRAKIASVKSSIKTWHKDYGDGWGATCAKLKIKVTVKKVKKATGYDVKISKNKKFKNKEPFNMASKWVKTKSGKSKIKTFGNNFVRLDTKYYIKARAYKKSHGKIIYGKWSKVKTVAALKLPTNNNTGEEQANNDDTTYCASCGVIVEQLANRYYCQDCYAIYNDIEPYSEQYRYLQQKQEFLKSINTCKQMVLATDYYFPYYNNWDIVTYAQEQAEIATNAINNANSINEYKKICNALNKDFEEKVVGYTAMAYYKVTE